MRPGPTRALALLAVLVAVDPSTDSEALTATFMLPAFLAAGPRPGATFRPPRR